MENGNHSYYLRQQNFSEHLQYDIFNEAELKILKKYGHWLKALAFGELKPTTTEQSHFVNVHSDIEEPKNEYEHVWVKLQNAIRTSKELYEKARLLQKELRSSDPSKRYQSILEAYIKAANAGSYKAKQWLEQQQGSAIKQNSIWIRPEGFSGGQVNNRYGEDIMPLIPEFLDKN